MSWGPATVFIHRKLNADGSAVGPALLNILPSDSITYDDDKPSTTGDHGPMSPLDDIDDDDDEDDEDEDEDVSDGNGDYDDDIDMYISQKSSHVLSSEELVHDVPAPSPLSQPGSSVGSPTPPGLGIGSSKTSMKASPSTSFVGNRFSPSTSSSTAAEETPSSVVKSTPSSSKTPPTAKQQSPTKIPKPETPQAHSMLSPQQTARFLSSSSVGSGIALSSTGVGELSSPTCMNSPFDSGLLVRKRAAPRKAVTVASTAI